MFFSCEEIEQLEIARLAVPGRCRRLQERYVYREYGNARSYEFARHGFSRRIKALSRCIENVFDILPPDCDELPDKDNLTDVAINIQAFVFNVFGAIDNLAWIYVYESGLTQQNGRAVPPKYVGLRPRNRLVRDALSPGFREYLEGLGGWFENLEDFRHALAHRIPLYVPPYVVPDEKMPAYRELEEQINAATRAGDFDEYDRLSDEQCALGSFAPLMTHSFEENANRVIFHPQLIADFSTVEEIAERMSQEL